MPNLNTTGHWGVGALARFNFQLEYQKGWDNTVADMLSQITTYLSWEAVWSVPGWCIPRCSLQGRGLWPCSSWRWLWLRKRGMCCRAGVGLDAHDWLGQNTERGPQYWMQCWTGWKPERRLIWRHSWESMPLVWMANWFGGITRILWSTKKPSTYAWHLRGRVRILCSSWSHGCIGLPLWMDVTGMWGHQGYDHTLSLLQECFWWPGMTSQMQPAIRNCMCCLQDEGGLPKALYTPSWLLLPWISYMLTSPA